jgi:hypothetical protein
MAPRALFEALSCRAKAETAAAIFQTTPLKPGEPFQLLSELFATGDDEVTLATLNLLAAKPENEPYRQTLQQLTDYLHKHPRTAELMARASGFAEVTDDGVFRGERNAYAEGVVARAANQLSTAGLRQNAWETVARLESERREAFRDILPPKPWGRHAQ